MLKSKVKTLLYVLLAFIGLYLLIHTLKVVLKKDRWKGFYYPGGNLLRPIYSGDFLTHSDCILWAEGLLDSRPQDRDIRRSNLYECGKNCELSDTYKYLVKNKPDYKFRDYPTYVCEETF